MSLSVSFRHSAHAEFIEAAAWYKSDSAVYEDVRRVVAKRFPFSVYFRAEARGIVVLAVGYQIGGALVGGAAPLVGTLLLAADHGRWRWIACYIAGISLVSFIAASRSVQASRVAAEGSVVGAA